MLSPKSRRFALFAPALALLATSSLGCAADDGGMSDPDSWEFPSWASKSDDIGSGLTSTRDSVVVAFDGYNHVADMPIGRNCVLPEPGELEFASFRAGGDQLTTEFRYIESREELEEALDIDAAAAIKIGPLGGGGTLGIARNYKSSEKTLSILLRTRQLYQVVNQDRHNLTSDALSMLRNDAGQFVRECGTGYVAGVAYGAELSMLIQIETSSIDESKEVKTMLEAQGIKAGPASIDASLGTAFSNALSQSDIQVSVSIEGRGFVPTVDINALSALDENAFMVAHQAQQEMQASVANDKCHDQGDAGPGTCDGAAARGYLGNGARVAVAMGLLHQPFQRAANFPGDAAVVDAMLEVNRQANGAIATLQEYAEIYRSMIAVHNDEVGAMLSSDAPYEYAIYDTTGALAEEMTFSELQSHAAQWADEYEPDNGTQVRALADAVSDCWSRAQFGDFTDCQIRPGETAAGQAVLAKFGEYEQQRVRQIYYTFDDAALNHGPADTACPTGWRQPSAGEASRAWFAVERDPGMPLCTDIVDLLQSDSGVWYDDEGASCAEEEGAWIERGDDGTFRTGCHEDAFLADDPELIALCVPTSGVFGSSVPDLPSP